MKDSYLTISDISTAEIKISKSRFISYAYPVSEREVTSDIINDFKKKYYDASHFPFAFRTGIDMNDFRYSDDGEPTGSAGKPLLESIDKFELTNVLVIVARYFGGVKLGTGGLRRAFFAAGEECLNNSNIVRQLIKKTFQIEFGYHYIGSIMNILEKEKIDILKNDSKEQCSLFIGVRQSIVEDIILKFTEITNGEIKVHEIE
ncbi:MAG: YigZ family protein [Ignavibacteria bacterium]